MTTHPPIDECRKAFEANYDGAYTFEEYHFNELFYERPGSEYQQEINRDWITWQKAWKAKPTQPGIDSTVVPNEITQEMQHAYFDVIDKNLPRVETDAMFGRYASQKEAYRAMLKAAPATTQPGDVSLVERVAEEIYSKNTLNPWEDLHECSEKNDYREMAKAAIAAMTSPIPCMAKRQRIQQLSREYEAAKAKEQPDDWRPPCPEIEPIRALAREVGYAVGVHGTLIRDFDLIAAPWTDDAVAYNVLIDHLCKGLNANLIDGPTGKPLGRRSCCIQIKDRYLKHIDLSIMPRSSERELSWQPIETAPKGDLIWLLSCYGEAIMGYVSPKDGEYHTWWNAHIDGCNGWHPVPKPPVTPRRGLGCQKFLT